MTSARWLRVFAPIVLSLVLFVTACTPSSSSRYSQIQKETTRRGAPTAVAKTAEQGSTFNKFFPGSTGTYEVVPTQEKKGFAEYKVNQNGKTVAMLSINDTSSLPTAAAKYKTSTEKVSGYPAVDQGTSTTGLLVNNRYQVKVLSRDPSFTKDDRVAWLQKFDLRGLAKLEAAPTTATAPSPRTSNRTSKIPNSTPAVPKASKAPSLAPAALSDKTKTADAKPKLEFPPILSPQPAT